MADRAFNNDDESTSSPLNKEQFEASHFAKKRKSSNDNETTKFPQTTNPDCCLPNDVGSSSSPKRIKTSDPEICIKIECVNDIIPNDPTEIVELLFHDEQSPTDPIATKCEITDRSIEQTPWKSTKSRTAGAIKQHNYRVRKAAENQKKLFDKIHETDMQRLPKIIEFHEISVDTIKRRELYAKAKRDYRQRQRIKRENIDNDICTSDVSMIDEMTNNSESSTNTRDIDEISDFVKQRRAADAKKQRDYRAREKVKRQNRINDDKRESDCFSSSTNTLEIRELTDNEKLRRAADAKKQRDYRAREKIKRQKRILDNIRETDCFYSSTNTRDIQELPEEEKQRRAILAKKQRDFRAGAKIKRQNQMIDNIFESDVSLCDEKPIIDHEQTTEMTNFLEVSVDKIIQRGVNAKKKRDYRARKRAERENRKIDNNRTSDFSQDYESSNNLDSLTNSTEFIDIPEQLKRRRETDAKRQRNYRARKRIERENREFDNIFESDVSFGYESPNDSDPLRNTINSYEISVNMAKRRAANAKKQRDYRARKKIQRENRLIENFLQSDVSIDDKSSINPESSTNTRDGTEVTNDVEEIDCRDDEELNDETDWMEIIVDRMFGSTES